MVTSRSSMAIGSVDWWADRQGRMARRRPRPDGLTIERIVEVALVIVDRDGFDALTVRRLGDELGTGSASLYRHVVSRQELLVLVSDHVFGEVEFPPCDLTGRQKVERLSTELRRVLLAHPNLLPALRVAPLFGPNVMRGANQALSYLLESGISPRSAASACFALIDFVLGTVFFETSTTGQVPHEAHEHIDLTETTLPTPDEIFSFGLTMFLDGLALHHPPPR